MYNVRYAINDICRGTCETIGDLNRSLRSRYLAGVNNEKTSCSLVLSALLTKKVPSFLSRLNETSGGCEKILPVSGSFWSNLNLLRMILLTA